MKIGGLKDPAVEFIGGPPHPAIVTLKDKKDYFPIIPLLQGGGSS